jgi:hypothetical protein
MSKTEVIILGCGSSLGVPRIDGYWGGELKKIILKIIEQDVLYL